MGRGVGCLLVGCRGSWRMIGGMVRSGWTIPSLDRTPFPSVKEGTRRRQDLSSLSLSLGVCLRLWFVVGDDKGGNF